MRITKVHIDEYKIFKNFDIDFTHEGKSQNLIVLAGINGTGKTTLLEYLVNEVDTKEAEKNLKGFIDIELSSGKILKINKHKERFNSNVFPYVFFKTTKHPDNYIKEALVDFVDRCIFEKNMLAFDAYSLLKEFIDSVLEGFNLNIYFNRLTGQKEPLFANKVYADLKIEDLSSGEKQLLSSVIWLFTNELKGTVILIDEPEYSLHPSWQNLIAQVYQRYADKYNCQIILATHSPQIIGSVRPEQIRILKNDNGVISAIEPTSSYGLPVDRVLMEVMGIQHLRTPDIDNELDALNAMISNNQYEDSSFISRMKKMEETLGFADRNLVLMRFEIAKRKKQK